MKLALLGAALLGACATAPRAEGKMNERSSSEIEQRVEVLLTPSGDPQFQHYTHEALAWLLAHGDAAHARLLALCEVDEPPGVLLEALPRFARAESVPVLERALRGASDPTTVVAAQALAAHPAALAREALERALGDRRDQVVASAAGGLAERGDRAACAALDGAAAHPNAEVRERIERARHALGCGAATPRR
jgi:HEAT repeat protein